MVRVRLVLLASLPLISVPATACFGQKLSYACAGYYGNGMGTANDCVGDASQTTVGGQPGTASYFYSPSGSAQAGEGVGPAQISVFASAETSDYTNGFEAVAYAVGHYVDTLTFQHVTMAGGAAAVATPLFLAPGSIIEISEPISATVSGNADAQTSISFGNPEDLSSILLDYSTASDKFVYLSGHTPAGAGNTFQDIGGVIDFYIKDPALGVGPVPPIQFGLKDSVFAAANGSASINDPITFTIYDANGNVIPDIEIQGSSGYYYAVTDGYVPESGPTSATPEPSSLLLLATGLAGTWGAVCRKITGRA